MSNTSDNLTAIMSLDGVFLSVNQIFTNTAIGGQNLEYNSMGIRGKYQYIYRYCKFDQTKHVHILYNSYWMVRYNIFVHRKSMMEAIARQIKHSPL